METKYIIPDITTGEPVEVTKEVYEAYNFLIDNIKKKDEEKTYFKLFRKIPEGFHMDKLLKLKNK